MRETDLEIVKKSYADKRIEIKGIAYTMCDLTNDASLEIMGLGQLCGADGSRINDANWKKLEKKLCDAFMIDNQLLSRLPNHFEINKGSYITFISYALAMVSFPFIYEV